MKVAPVAFLGVVAGMFVLAGCEHVPTLEEARAACTKQGGFLVVIYTQEVTLAGVGPEIASPGDCVSSAKFDIAPAASASAAPQVPASGKAAAPAN